MAGLIPEEVIAEIRDRTDIIQVIGQYVELRRAGINHKGLCPFHDEKTPSFNVNSQRQFYHCFGCQESGDVISFLMKIEGRRFSEVVEDLAARAGVEIPKKQVSKVEAQRAARQRSERQQGLDLNVRVAELYVRLLQADSGHTAREYLAKRGITPQVAHTFRLGFAPPGGSAVVALLQKEQLSFDLGLRLGLVARRRSGEGYHDRFWNRLIFPVIGAGGEVLGFGGRLLGDGDGPKYINTPETALYRKGEVLYGLHAAAGPMRKSNTALLVEGNIDVLQMHQHALDNTVAPMGTALTPRQVRLIRRFCSQAVALFDGDAAGQAAAFKSVPVLLEGGLEQAKIATLPTGEDPDSLLQKQGLDAMRQILLKAVPMVDFALSQLLEQMEDTVAGRSQVIERLAPLVGKLPSQVARDLYIDRIALTLSIDPAHVRRAIRGQRAELPQGPRRPAQPATAAAPLPPAELDLLAILAEHPHLFARAQAADVSSLLTNDSLRATYQAAMQMQKNASGRIDTAQLLQLIPREVKNSVAEALGSRKFATDGDPTRALDDCLAALKRRELSERKRKLQQQLKRAKDASDAQTLLALTQELVEVEKKLHGT